MKREVTAINRSVGLSRGEHDDGEAGTNEDSTGAQRHHC